MFIGVNLEWKNNEMDYFIFRFNWDPKMVSKNKMFALDLVEENIIAEHVNFKKTTTEGWEFKGWSSGFLFSNFVLPNKTHIKLQLSITQAQRMPSTHWYWLEHFYLSIQKYHSRFSMCVLKFQWKHLKFQLNGICHTCIATKEINVTTIAHFLGHSCVYTTSVN